MSDIINRAEFIHLHNHSHYSLLDGAMTVDRMLDTALADGQDAIALTDHGNMFGAIEFYTKAKKKGIKPIIGCEVYVAPMHRTDRNEVKSLGINEYAYHLVLLAENEIGYQNLMILSSMGYLEGFYYKPRVDLELLHQYHHGLIAMSACLAGEVPNKILRNDEKAALAKAMEFNEIFGKGSFYLELQDHGIPEQKTVNQSLIQFSKKTGIALVASNDAHYAKSTDSFSHEVLLCIQTGSNLSDEKRMRFTGNQFYLKTQQEMKELFHYIPEAIHSTREIADRINLKIKLGESVLPEYEIPVGYTPATYLEHLAHEGKKWRYEQITEEIESRINYELSVINKMNFAGYFLIVQDFIRFARKSQIPVGPGRGSAAGSIVSYCLGITDVEPLRYSLLFERFLNPDRIEMPDVDIDFCKDRREEVIQYVQEKYGKEKVSQVIAFGSIKSKNAIKDVGRTMGIPYNETDRLAKLIPGDPVPVSLTEALEKVEELREYRERDKQSRLHIETSLNLEGLVRQASKHAAGVVIAPGKVMDYAPLFVDKDGNVATQYEKNTLAEVGLVKMDFLGLRNLTIIDHAKKLIKKNHGKDIDFNDRKLRNMDDKKSYGLLSKGKGVGVFQLESQGMIKLLRKAKPQQFEDIVAILALYRPGPLNSGMVDTYLRRKAGKEVVVYDHPDLESVLKDTYGVIVYQEQVMLISQIIGGFSMSEADVLRKVMGKKLKDKMPAQKEKFLKGAALKNIDEKLAAHIFDQCATFAKYGFNKSHSVAYAVVTYQTAYLKAHYPAEYMAALISEHMEDTDKVVKYIHEAKSMNLSLLPPDINQSERDFTTMKKGIGFGLSAIKNIGAQLVDDILTERKAGGPFTSVYNLAERVKGINIRALESLIAAGVFDAMGFSRRGLYENAKIILEQSEEKRKDREVGQFNLFGGGDSGPDMREVEILNKIKRIPEWPLKEKLKKEKEIIGFYLTGHILDDYKDIIKKINPMSISLLEEVEDRTQVLCVGAISKVNIKYARKDNKPYAFFTLDTYDGNVEVMVFNIYLDGGKEKNGIEVSGIRRKLIENSIVAVEGELRQGDEGEKLKIYLRRFYSIEEAQVKAISALHLHVQEKEYTNEIALQMRDILANAKGSRPVYIHVKNGKEKNIIQVNDSLWVEPTIDLLTDLSRLIGEKNVIQSYHDY